MWIDEDLPETLADAIKPIGASGDELAANNQHDAAIARYREAYSLLPDPKEQWLAGTWLLTAIGDAAYLSGDLPLAVSTFQEVGFYPGWEDNAFIRLRRGQVAYDTGKLDVASNELACAFMLGGYDVLDQENEKYAEFVLSKLRPPSPPVKHRLARFHLKEPRPSWKFW